MELDQLREELKKLQNPETPLAITLTFTGKNYKLSNNPYLQQQVKDVLINYYSNEIIRKEKYGL